MKRRITLCSRLSVALSVLFLAFAPHIAKAQAPTLPNDSVAGSDVATNRADSLQQVVNDLQLEADKAKKEEQFKRIWKRRKHWSFSYIPSASMTISRNKDAKVESEIGVNIQRGRTWYIPKKALAGMIRFGIDLDPMDITFVKYKKVEGAWTEVDDNNYYDPTFPAPMYESTTSKSGSHINYALGFGPSVTVNPIDYLMVNTYFHWLPGASALLYDGSVCWGFANQFSYGLHVSWKVISLGFEARWGSAKLSTLDIDDVMGEVPGGGSSSDGEQPEYTGNDFYEALSRKDEKVKLKSFLLTVSFRL